jgi:RNA-directed DNA polymerase
MRIPKKKVGNFVGGVVSPILANIYLHEFDEFMEQKKQEFDQGKARK